MKTQVTIWDSLYGAPIRKAALVAYLELAKNTAGIYGQICRQRADKIAKRFKINDLILQWRNAAPVN